MTPEFLDLEDVLAIQARQLERFGGSAGIRDMGLLESAIAQPQAQFGGEFLHEDLFAMAAAYLFHIVKNHPFIDGNKRTGFIAAAVFLKINGAGSLNESPELYEMTLAVADGSLDKTGLADRLRELALPEEI
jgi:death-on-curing protein